MRSSFRDDFRTRPNEYHNGGLWPMVSGWWGAALVASGEVGAAERLLAETCAFNQQGSDSSGGGFYECGNSMTGRENGTRRCTWSASGQLMIEAALRGKSLYFG